MCIRDSPDNEGREKRRTNKKNSVAQIGRYERNQTNDNTQLNIGEPFSRHRIGNTYFLWILVLGWGDGTRCPKIDSRIQ